MKSYLEFLPCNEPVPQSHAYWHSLHRDILGILLRTVFFFSFYSYFIISTPSFTSIQSKARPLGMLLLGLLFS